MRPRSRLADACLASGAIACVLLSLELAVRLLESRKGGGKEDRARSQYTSPDPILGWRKRPGARALYRRAEYTVEVVINSLGMRDPERTLGPREGTHRILALGDSFVEGYTVAIGKDFTQTLERALTSSACSVEVLNGGTTGYSTDQEYLYYREEAGAFGARTVLLLLYYNDILANVRADYWGQPKPVLEERDGRLQVVARRLPKPGARADSSREGVAPGEPEPEKTAAFEGSALLGFCRARLLRGQPELYQKLASFGLWPPLEPEAPPAEMGVYRVKLAPVLNTAWQRTLRIVESLAAECASRGARLVVVYVPAAFEVNDRAWELTRLAYGMREPEWWRSVVVERLVKVGRKRGIPVLDLTAPLREAERHGGTYFTFDPHWNERGHGAAARAVAAFLLQGGFLGCTKHPE